MQSDALQHSLNAIPAGQTLHCSPERQGPLEGNCHPTSFPRGVAESSPSSVKTPLLMKGFMGAFCVLQTGEALL